MGHCAALLLAPLLAHCARGHDPPARAIEWPDGCNSATLCARALMAIPVWPKGCQDDPELDYPKSLYSKYTGELRIRFFPLAPGRYLVEFPCIRGAYNARNLYALYDETEKPPRAEMLKFLTREPACCDIDAADPRLPARWAEADVVGGQKFDAASKQLFALVRGRALGDCGTWARYAFPNGRPQLQEYWAKDSCDGIAALGDAYDVALPPAGWQKLR